MGKKCSKCSKVAAVEGFENVNYMTLAAVIAAGYIAGQIDSKMLVANSDGTPKTEGFFVDNPPARGALFVAAGVGLLAYMEDDLSKGAAYGLAAYGGYQLIDYYMKKQAATNSVNYVYANNQNVMGIPDMDIPGHNSPGSYGYRQSNINGSDEERRMLIDKARAYDRIVNNDMKINGDISKDPVKIVRV